MRPVRILDHTGLAQPHARPDISIAPLGSEAPAQERSRYSGSSSFSRSLAFSLALILHGLVALGLLIKWGHDTFVVAEPAPLVASFDVPAAPPQPQHEVPEGPVQVEQQAQQPEKQDEAPLDWPEPVLPPLLTRPAPERARPIVAANPVPETTAPKSLPAPPASRLASNTQSSWEGLLLAHLEMFRRYPASSRARHEQGVAHVRFTMDREGRLLDSDLARTSGSRRLDEAALATIKRASPFPKPPEEVEGTTIELVVPVEFFMRN